MPEMHFLVRWPDGRHESCYSPSLVVREHFREGAEYSVSDFRALARTALEQASARVRAKHGHACSLALGQLARIETACALFEADSAARVTCEAFL